MRERPRKDETVDARAAAIWAMIRYAPFTFHEALGLRAFDEWTADVRHQARAELAAEQRHG